MDLTDFLRLIVPASGKLVIAKLVERTGQDGEKFKTFFHYVCDTHEEAAELAGDLSAQQFDVYFALASYKQGLHVGSNGKKVLRTHDNVCELKALWFDVDLKDGYPDLPAAGVALRDFCRQSKMPPPTALVGSGNGLHVYWVLDIPLGLERWQKLSEALKDAAKTLGFKADLKCTADASRVLRPPGTLNFKDPTNPKLVRVLHCSGVEYSPEELEAALLPFAPSAKPKAGKAVNDELTGGVGGHTSVPAFFAEIVKGCPVSAMILDSGGKDCSEPEWVSVLQLLKHCEDGEEFYHRVSSGHPGYSEAATERKWQQRLANTAGPTLCSTFELTRSSLCSACPHSGFIKSPIQLGVQGANDDSGFPFGYRVAPDNSGVERLMITEGGTKEWVLQFRPIPVSFRPLRSLATSHHDMVVTFKRGEVAYAPVVLPMSLLGNTPKLLETLAGYGIPLKPVEAKPFGEFMISWYDKLHQSRRVAEVCEHLGWHADSTGKITSFACSPTVYYADGHIRNDVRPAREFAAYAALYEPKGELDEWKKVAKFITDQNHPALTAVLAASFGSPLLRFVGIQGGILSLVSTASGVGKSSILKLSQSVWGTPVHAMNSVDDTPKSVLKKIGFLNSLPVFWDELRGRTTIDGFCNLAFQLTQGKDRSRLNSGAHLQSSGTWETMLTVASNESIFEGMARRTAGSDAGTARVFEIEMTEAPKAEMTPAQITVLIDMLRNNYGHAGRVYAQYLAMHATEVHKRVQEKFLEIGETMRSQDRFWVGMVTILIVGAEIANKLKLVTIDIDKMERFLDMNTAELRERTALVESENNIAELLAEFLRDFGDRVLVLEKFPNIGMGRPTKDLDVAIRTSPRSEKASIVYSLETKAVRFAKRDFMQWLIRKGVSAYGVPGKLVKELKGRDSRLVLAPGTIYAGPRVNAWEVVLDDSIAAGVLNPGGSSDSSSSAQPED